jgi:hypothetical protein
LIAEIPTSRNQTTITRFNNLLFIKKTDNSINSLTCIFMVE